MHHSSVLVTAVLLTATLGACARAGEPARTDVASAPAPEYLAPYGTPTLPFSPAVRVGDMLYLSGQIGTDSTGRLVPGGIEAETRQTLEKIRDLLERTGSSLDRVVKCTVMLADMREWPAMNAVYATYFPRNRPARSAFAASGLALDARVEIECMAAAGTARSAETAAGETATTRWRATFVLDSVRASGTAAWTQPRGDAAARGTLVVAGDLAEDVAGGAARRRMRGEMTVDFTPVLGRQMSCYAPGPLELSVESVGGGARRLAFTPDARDCGFAAVGEWVGDTLVGTWDESSFAGSVAAGRFRLEPVR